MKFLFGVNLTFIILIKCEGFDSKLFSTDVLIDKKSGFSEECKKALNKTKIFTKPKDVISTRAKNMIVFMRKMRTDLRTFANQNGVRFAVKQDYWLLCVRKRIKNFMRIL
jgi:hypothetical protein